MEQLFQILNFLISYVFCPPLIMSHIFREHLFYIEVYNREYAGIPLSGQFIQVCPTIYVSIPISKMTIIILQVCEIYRIEQFSFIYIITQVIFLNGRHIVRSSQIQCEFPQTLKQCRSMKHTFIIIARSNIRIAATFWHRFHALLYHTYVNSILPQQPTFIVEETQLVVESHISSIPQPY